MKLTKRQQQVIAQAQEAPIIQLSGGEFCFSNGKNVRRDVVRRLIDAGYLKPNQDGLFPGFNQSYSA